MTRRARGALLALVAAQACHSAEEYSGRLWEVLPPAALVSGLFSSDRRAGFLIANALLVAFGLACCVVGVRGAAAAVPLAWFWIVLETVNALVHTVWALAAGAYRPGLATAPLLLAAAIFLMREMRRSDASAEAESSGVHG